MTALIIFIFSITTLLHAYFIFRLYKINKRRIANIKVWQSLNSRMKASIVNNCRCLVEYSDEASKVAMLIGHPELACKFKDASNKIFKDVVNIEIAELGVMAKEMSHGTVAEGNGQVRSRH